MKRLILAATAALAGLLLAAPAYATGDDNYGGDNPNGFTTCKNLAGWYANPDEQDALPTPTGAGLRFDGKDLIHHATSPIDLADMDKVSGSFVATVPGKVVFKVETSSPYSTIITNADGKHWSTAMTYDQQGGQGHPVSTYSELVGLDTKPGKAKYTAASAVTTFGVGYWVEEGSTVVSSISFHGTTYDLTCKQASPSPSATVTTKPTVKPSASASTKPTVKPTGSSTGKPTASQSTTVVVPVGNDEPSLPVTGSPAGVLMAAGVALVIFGGLLYLSGRRRRDS